MVQWLSNMKAKESNKKPVLKSVRESKGAGSRRIFSPVFKLQVLDSYRHDADCQGNQRATARKYGIHRRQIQKWLQMEATLRLSVQQSDVVTAALNLSPTRQTDAIGLLASDINSSCSSSTQEDTSSIAGKDECNSDGEEYVNVDEITDSEDDDDDDDYDDETSSCSSHEKALDLTCATLSKRRFYTTDFKLLVLEAFKTDPTCVGNQRATARKFGIHRRQVQKWLNQEQLIKSQTEHVLNNPCCLDLSSCKRKLADNPDEFVAASKRCRTADTARQEALCLVKDSKASEADSFENNVTYHHILYPSSTDHSYTNLPHLGHDYPLLRCNPWYYTYPAISDVSSPDATYNCLPKYSCSLNLRCETSYVNIPVQYGFGDSVPSKWIKENGVYPVPVVSPRIQVFSGVSTY